MPSGVVSVSGILLVWTVLPVVVDITPLSFSSKSSGWSEVKLYVTSEKAEGVMTIPVDAVYYENGEPYVYTYSDGKVWQKFIEEGIFDSDILEVKSGLSMDDMVVTTWSSELYDGAEVRLKGETTQDDSTGDAAGAPAGGPEGNAPGGPGAPMTGNKAQ